VSRETVRIALLITLLNNVDIWAADVLNAYITVPCQEKICTTLGKEFGDNCGRKVIVVHAPYGMKSEVLPLVHTWQDTCKRWANMCHAPLIPTCGSRNKQAGK
jgi:23S rRNA A2030 N6-methylase RlmJ